MRVRVQPVGNAHQVELRRLLESVAYCVQQWYGASYLVIDRTEDPESADIRAYFGGGRLVDLWELNPLLWDDAQWAALRLVAAGSAEIVLPELHRS